MSAAVLDEATFFFYIERKGTVLDFSTILRGIRLQDPSIVHFKGKKIITKERPLNRIFFSYCQET